jgi:hypothetical protein
MSVARRAGLDRDLAAGRRGYGKCTVRDVEKPVGTVEIGDRATGAVGTPRAALVRQRFARRGGCPDDAVDPEPWLMR